MKALIHYTTNNEVYSFYKQDEGKIEYTDQVEELDKYYTKYCNIQINCMFFIIVFSDRDTIKKIVLKIRKNDDDTFNFTKVEEDVERCVLEDAGLNNRNSYIKDMYYREFTLVTISDFFMKEINSEQNKIKLKYFSWNELTSDINILHDKLLDLIFDEENILKLASLYTFGNPKTNARISRKQYYKALDAVGFIAEKSINTSHKVLHGDIGEIITHIMIIDLLESQKEHTYYYPKLAFKTHPKVSVHGNDGVLYNPKEKKIFNIESKFYTTLDDGIDDAVDSLIKHNKENNEPVDHNISVFRSATTNFKDELVEIDDNTNEVFVISIICSKIYLLGDIEKILNSNKKLSELKSYDLLIYIIPIIDKEGFLTSFKNKSDKIGEEYYGSI